MNAHRLLSLVVVVLSFVSTAATAESPLVIRTAQRVGIIYLFPFVALWRHDQPQGVTPKRLYTQAISRWLNEPELTGQTGDILIEPLVNAVTTLGVDQAKRVAYGYGNTPNPDASPDTERFFVITADRAYYFRKRDEWLSFLRERLGILEPKFDDAESLFQTLSKRA